jgi:N-acetylmuramoyl-L-alanine amidase
MATGGLSGWHADGGTAGRLVARCLGIVSMPCLSRAASGRLTAQETDVMSKNFARANVRSLSIRSLAAVFLIMVSAPGSGAAAQLSHQPVASEPTLQTVPVPAADGNANAVSAPQPSVDVDNAPAAVNPATLTQLVASQSMPEEVSPELNCLAGAVYFEARNETLDGQLAVARVIVARSRSGRFPASYCGVVYQPSQFSFIHGGVMPVINHSSAAWRRVVAIAEIANDGSWQSPVEGALFFHSARISPKWHRQRVARIDNHVFYR